MQTRGFTIVEIIITVTIMGILLTLGVFAWNGAQANARDDERVTDIKNIQLALESYYQTGTDGSTTIGTYGTTAIVASLATINTALQDIDDKSVQAPGVSGDSVSLIAATNNTQTAAGVSPQPTTSQYVYQPINQQGDLCASGECRKYNLYYRLEADDTVYKVTSKNQ